MTSFNSENMRFRTLDDGTILYRRSRSTRTHVITSEQRDQIYKIHGKGITVASLLSPPIFGFGFTSLEGNFSLIWQITGVYTLLYFVFIFIYSNNIYMKIDRICQHGRLASPEEEIVILPFWDRFRDVIASKTLSEKIALYVSSLVTACLSSLVAYSAVFDSYFLHSLGFHWVAAFLFGLLGVIMSGTPIAAAVHNILEKRE